MGEKVKILGLVGSLRKGSYNKALMRAAIELTPEDAIIDVFDLALSRRLTRTWKKTNPR